MTPIIENSKRFALYDDLKDLHNKCIPEIAKFESRLIELDSLYEKNNLIIREFDNSLAQKASKFSFKEFTKFVDQNYLKVEDSNQII